MASIILKWLRRCIFICFCAVFLMSHNASAADVSINATPTGSGQTCINGYANNDLIEVCGLIQNTNSDILGTVGYIQPIIGGTYYSDTVIQLEFTIYRFSNNTSSHAVVNGIQNQVPTDASGIDWDLIGYNYEDLNTGTGKLKLLFKHKSNSGLFRVKLAGNNGGWIFGLMPGDRVAGINYTVFAINDANAGSQQIVNAINSMPNYSNNLNAINNNINSVNNNLNQVNNSINNINSDVENATQDAADAAGDSGDQSAADAENATAGLISVIGGFVNAITSASPSDCKINGKINNSFNMGELDLCSMPVPPFVQIISSLILIAICIPFAIIMFNRFIGLFRSFQG